MRTTLEIDDDLLATAKRLALAQRKSMSQVISALVRQGLEREAASPATRNGVPLLPVRDRDGVVTLELINRLRDELP